MFLREGWATQLSEQEENNEETIKRNCLEKIFEEEKLSTFFSSSPLIVFKTFLFFFYFHTIWGFCYRVSRHTIFAHEYESLERLFKWNYLYHD